MSSALYTPEILRLSVESALSPRLPAPMGSAERRAALCGSRVIVDVMVDPDGLVSNVGLEVRACALGQASAALLARSARGRDAQALESLAQDLEAWLADHNANAPDWPSITLFEAAREKPARHGAILIPFEAAAIAARAALAVAA